MVLEFAPLPYGNTYFTLRLLEICLCCKGLITVATAAFKKTRNKLKDKFNKPWWNSHCSQATALRRRAKNLMEKRPTTENINAYKRLHAAAIRIHKAAKRLSWRKYVSKITEKTTKSEIWRVIRSFNGKINRIRYPLKDGDQLVFNIQRQTDIHARHQQSTMSSGRFEYDREDLRLIDNAANDMSYTAYNELFKTHELLDSLQELKAESAYGTDEVNNKFLKHLPS